MRRVGLSLLIVLGFAAAAGAGRGRLNFIPMQSQPVFWLKCNDNADSNTVIDSSGYGNHATMRSDFELPEFNLSWTSFHTTSGVVGNALKIYNAEWSQNIIQVPDAASIQFGTGSFSVCFWMTADESFGGDGAFVLYKGAQFNIGLREIMSLDVYFVFGSELGSSGAKFRDGDPHFVCFVRDMAIGKQILYFDGVVSGTPVSVAAVDVSYIGSDLFIGGLSADFTWLTIFTLDEFMFFKRALSAAEVAWLYNGGSGREDNVGELELQYPLGRERY